MKGKLTGTLALFFFLATGAFGAAADSLLKLAENGAAPAQDRYKALFELEQMNRDSFAQADLYMDMAAAIARSEKNDTMLFRALQRKYFLNMRVNKMSEAYLFTQKMLEIAEARRDTHRMAIAFTDRGNLFRNLNLLDKAAEWEKQAVAMYMRTPRLRDQAYHTYLLGFYLFNDRKYKEALPCFKKAYKMHLKGKHGIYELAETSGWIGNAYSGLGDYANALKYRYISLNYALQSGDHFIMGDSYRYLGNVYRKMKHYEDALINYERSFELFRKSGSTHRAGLVLFFTAETYAEMKDYKKAAEILDKVFIPGQGYDDLLISELINKLGGKVYKLAGQPEKSISCLSRYIAISDSVLATRQADKVMEEGMKYAFDREQQRMKLEQEKQEALRAEEKQQAALVRNGIIAGLVLCFFIALALFRGYVQKRRSNRFLSVQKLVIEQKNKEITDSINYAKHIQESILPPQDLVYEYLKECFVLYKPKDIVSGDFYWVERSDNRVLFAAVDCTGHGVPGALMSVLGNSALNTVVSKNPSLSPAAIMNQLNEAVKETLSHKYRQTAIHDGMDMALCSLDRQAMKLQFSGARNPVCIIRNGELIELKGDKQAIAARDEQDFKPFKDHTVELQKGDCIYIFSDGYGDQFGGLKGKKFKYTRMKELFKEIALRPMYQQKQALDKIIEEWRGSLEQVDDILVMGVRV